MSEKPATPRVRVWTISTTFPLGIPGKFEVRGDVKAVLKFERMVANAPCAGELQ